MTSWNSCVGFRTLKQRCTRCGEDMHLRDITKKLDRKVVLLNYGCKRRRNWSYFTVRKSYVLSLLQFSELWLTPNHRHWREDVEFEKPLQTSTRKWKLFVCRLPPSGLLSQWWAQECICTETYRWGKTTSYGEKTSYTRLCLSKVNFCRFPYPSFWHITKSSSCPSPVTQETFDALKWANSR